MDVPNHSFDTFPREERGEFCNREEREEGAELSDRVRVVEVVA
jgi:hypothetical protein